MVGFPHSTLARRSASWVIAPAHFHSGQRSESGNLYRNAHPVVER